MAHILSHYTILIGAIGWAIMATSTIKKVFDKLYWFGQYSFLCQIAKYYENNDLENVNREDLCSAQFPVEIWKEI